MKNLSSLLLSPHRHSEHREESRVFVLLLFFELDPSVALLPQDDEREYVEWQGSTCEMLRERPLLRTRGEMRF